MEIKTTLQISNDNADVIADMHEYGGLIEKYEGEFDETIFKKWVAVDDIIEKLESLTPGRFINNMDNEISQILAKLKSKD